MIQIYWTRDIPQKTGAYLIKKDSNISNMFVTIKDLEIQEKDSSYLGDVLWSTEEIEENFL